MLALRAWIQAHRPDRVGSSAGRRCPSKAPPVISNMAGLVVRWRRFSPAVEVPLELVEPSVWKRARHLHGGDKEGARQLALQISPLPTPCSLAAKTTSGPRPR